MEGRLTVKTKLTSPSAPDPVAVELQTPNPNAPTQTIVTVGDQQHEVDIESTAANAGLIRINHQVHRYVTHRDGDRILVWIDGQSFKFNTVNNVPRRSGAASTAAAGNDITAPMPGTILKILVDPGDCVTAHQPLIIMESMKMEMTLSAPADATIRQISCHEGELVERDATLATLERSE